MNWSDLSWELEDGLYAPKRKVDNTLSRYIGFNIGAIHSQKMKRRVEYESLTECLFFYYLELDPKTVRYYVQPVEVPVTVIQDDELSVYHHVPDVLVYRHGYPPTLIQIKAKELKPGDKNYPSFYRHNMACEDFAREHKWNYEIIRPREIDDALLKNIKNLARYTKQRKHFRELIPEILYKLRYIGPCSIIRLARGFEGTCHFHFILPHIYHLIAMGHITVNFYEEVDENSLIHIGSSYEQIEALFEHGGESENA